jgi:SOS-response transcriptional repressor LexA
MISETDSSKFLGSIKAQILAVVRTYYERDGVPPSIREIQTVLRIGSKETVHRHLQGLVVKGYLKQVRGMYVPRGER